MEKNIDLERKNNNEIGQVLYAIWKNITESTTEKKKSLISLMHVYVQYFHVNNLHSDKAQA